MLTLAELMEAPPADAMRALRALRESADRVEPAPAGAIDMAEDVEGDAPAILLDACGDWRADWEWRAASWLLGAGAPKAEIAALAFGAATPPARVS
jgi:hypothetical protein